MEYIDGKDIFLLMMDTLKFRNSTIVDHGYRMAFVAARMLQCGGKYEMFELADIVIYATFHDIGALVTEKPDTVQTYDVKDTMPHSVLGYLICKNLSPHEEMAPVILHHHTDYNRQPKMTDWQHELAAVFQIAERAVIYHSFLGEKFRPSMFDKLSGTRLWDRGVQWLKQADAKYRMFDRLRSGEYLKDMQKLLEFMIFNREEAARYMEAEMYFLGLRSRRAVVAAASCICVSRCIADRLLLSGEEKRILYYAALLHDVGMLAIPREIVEAPRRLTDVEKRLMETHLARAEEILKDRVAPEVLELILAHHERGDGSGYPRHLKEGQMSQLQKILQAADMFSALVHDRSYRPARNKKEVISIFLEERRRGRFPKQLVDIVTSDYDAIFQETRRETKQVLSMYRKLLGDYDKLSKQLRGQQ